MARSKISSKDVDSFGKGGRLLIVREGEGARFRVKSDGIYEILEGDDDLTGQVTEFNTLQTEVVDLDDNREKVLVVQRSLAKIMKSKMEEKGLDFDKDLKGLEFEVKRYGEQSWEVKLLSKTKKEAEKDANMMFENVLLNLLGSSNAMKENELISRIVLSTKGKIDKDTAIAKISEYKEIGALRETEEGLVLEA